MLTSDQIPVNQRSLKLSILVCSGLILLLELLLIRYIPSYIINFNYYANFVLLSAFLGIGVGLLLGTARPDLSRFFPGLLLVFIILISLTRIGLQGDNANSIFLQRNFGYYHLPAWLIVGIVCIVVTALFLTLSQRLGKLFATLRQPLSAYAWDLAGSVSGVLLFFFFSLLQTPPVLWFAVFSIGYLVLLRLNGERFRWIAAAPFLVLLVFVFLVGRNTFWSPYYKISLEHKLFPDQERTPYYELFVNDIGHQNLVLPKNKEFIYFSQYNNIKKREYRDALIIGSGAGNDIAIALANGVQNIDAVEIDPKIVDLGKKFHPAQPYSDPRVHVTVNDGRNFLETSSKKYDMIIFALTDSLTQASQQGAIRLESYLFTKEAFTQARNHLNDDGILVLYNYYWKDWLVDKIGKSVAQVFGQNPYVQIGGKSQLASFVVSKKPLEFTPTAPPSQFRVTDVPVATDDWPFMYLKKYYIPEYYLIACAAMLIFSVLLIWSVLRKGSIGSLHLPLFFTGAAFMLLETTAIAKFALLFGTTWMVNSGVILAVLLLAFLANAYVRRFSPARIWPFFLLLFAALFLYYFIPLHALLGMSAAARYIIASLLTLGPIFFAGIIFSTLFAKADRSNVWFGSNLLGAIFGGIVEYAALATGYTALILFVIAFYALAVLTFRFVMRRTVPSV